MVDDIETRHAFGIIDAADIHEYVEAVGFERLQSHTKRIGIDAFDACVGDIRPDGGRIGRRRPGRRRLRTRHEPPTNVSG